MKRDMAELLNDDSTRIRYVQENPKRRGSSSFERYELYKSATTVGQAIELGSLRPDVKYDFQRRFLHVEGVVEDPIEDPGSEPSSASRKRSAKPQEPSAWKKLKFNAKSKADEGRPTQRLPASPLHREGAEREAEAQFDEVCAQAEQAACDLAQDCGISQEVEVRDFERAEGFEDVLEQAEQAALDFAQDCEVPEAPELDVFQECQEPAAQEPLSLPTPTGEPSEKPEELLGGLTEPQALSGSQDGESEEITLRCRLGLQMVKEEVEEAEEEAEEAPERSGDLREIFGRQSRGADAQEQETAEDADEKQAFESAQELSLEQNQSERQLRQQRERDLLRQGSLEPLERLDEVLIERMTDAGFFSWLESEEHRELLYDFLELRSKAIAWYHEPAQAYFDSRREAMLAALAEPATEAFTSFIQLEKETVEQDMFKMPVKGHYVPELFNPHESLESSVDLGE